MEYKNKRERRYKLDKIIDTVLGSLVLGMFIGVMIVFLAAL